VTLQEHRPAKHHLIATKLCLQVGKRRLLNNVDLACSSGQWIQVTGANGVGKSTLLRLLAGISDSDTGSITLSIDNLEVTQRSSHLLYQGHLHGFKDQFTVIENLRLQLALDICGYQTATKNLSQLESTLNDAIGAVGLSNRTHLAFGKLSAGQKRRCMLARLVISNQLLSSIKLCWILDEPLTALDAEAQLILGDVVAKHLVTGGSAVLATHQDLTELGLTAPTTLNLSALRKIQIAQSEQQNEETKQ
jgi:heme exporter protein A